MQPLSPPPTTVDELDIKSLEKSKIHSFWLNLVQDGFGEWIKIPIIVIRKKMY